jgi:hypothetical protein
MFCDECIYSVFRGQLKAVFGDSNSNRLPDSYIFCFRGSQGCVCTVTGTGWVVGFTYAITVRLRCFSVGTVTAMLRGVYFYSIRGNGKASV